MLYRRAAAQHARPDGKLMLGDLLRLKTHRETSLRRQMQCLKRELDDIDSELLACHEKRAALALRRQHRLGWCGVAASRELLGQKHALEGMFEQDQALQQHQSSLCKTQLDRREELDRLRQRLITVMKKKEKLESLLNDVC